MFNKLLHGIAILFGVAMVVFGANKLFPFLPMPPLTPEQQEIFNAFATIKWLMPQIGVGEIVGGLLVIFPKTRALGAIMLIPITIGILMHHLTLFRSDVLMAAIFFLVNLWIIWDHRNQYKHMIKDTDY